MVSSALLEPISSALIENIEAFVKQQDLPLLTFGKKQRKDDLAAEYRARWEGSEGVLLVGKAQEKSGVFRTEKRTNPKTGKKYPWIVKSTAMVNQDYFACVDEALGPFFLKFSSYFPDNAKLCLNGHEYRKRQLAQEGIAFEALDKGLLTCAQPQRAQELCDSLSADQSDALLRKWLARLPHPFTAHDRAAGSRHDVSTLQAEFSRTHVLERPRSGRIFLAEVLRENLERGRPDQVQLLFDRRVRKRPPGRFRTRVVTEGVTPSLHVEYKSTRLKHYPKEGRALRTETTSNNPRDFGLGKRLENLPALRESGFQANRRLWHVQRTSHDGALGEDAFRQVNEPVVVQGQRASALRFGDPAVQALRSARLVFRLLPRGFSNRDLRDHWASLLGKEAQTMTPGQLSYHLRRLRLHGIMARLPGTHRYRVTDSGWRTALFCTRCENRSLRPGLAQVIPEEASSAASLRRCFDQLDAEIEQGIEQQKVPA